MKRTPLKRVSTKRQKEGKDYTKLRREFLDKHLFCEARVEGCEFRSCDVHHMKGRGKHYLEVNSWLAVCRPCHTFIHLHGKEAEKLGLVIREWKKHNLPFPLTS